MLSHWNGTPGHAPESSFASPTTVKSNAEAKQDLPALTPAQSHTGGPVQSCADQSSTVRSGAAQPLDAQVALNSDCPSSPPVARSGSHATELYLDSVGRPPSNCRARPASHASQTSPSSADVDVGSASAPLRTRKLVYQPRPLVSPLPSSGASAQRRTAVLQAQPQADPAAQSLAPILSTHSLLTSQGQAALAAGEDSASTLGSNTVSSRSTPELRGRSGPVADVSRDPSGDRAGSQRTAEVLVTVNSFSLAKGTDPLGLENWNSRAAQSAAPAADRRESSHASPQAEDVTVGVASLVPHRGLGNRPAALGTNASPPTSTLAKSASKPAQLLKGGSLRCVQGATAGPALGVASSQTTRQALVLAPRRASTGTPSCPIVSQSPYAKLATAAGGEEEDKHLQATLSVLARAGEVVGRMVETAEAQSLTAVPPPVQAAAAPLHVSPRASVPGLSLSSVTGVLPSPEASMAGWGRGRMGMGRTASHSSIGSATSRRTLTARSQSQSEGRTDRSGLSSNASPAPTARAVLGVLDSSSVAPSDISGASASASASGANSSGQPSAGPSPIRSPGDSTSAPLQRSGGSFRSQGSAQSEESTSAEPAAAGHARLSHQPSQRAVQAQAVEEQTPLLASGNTIAALTSAALANGSVPSLLTLLKTVTVYHADVVQQAREQRLNLLPSAVSKPLTEALVMATASLRLADAEISAIYRSKQKSEALSASQVSTVQQCVRAASCDVVACEAAYLDAKAYLARTGGSAKVKKVNSSSKLSSYSSSSSSSETATATATPAASPAPVPAPAPAPAASSDLRAGEIVETPLGPMVMVQGPAGFMAVPLASANPVAKPAAAPVQAPTATPTTVTEVSVEDSPAPTPVPDAVAAPISKVPSASKLSAPPAVLRTESEGAKGGPSSSSSDKQGSAATDRPRLLRTGSAESADSSASSKQNSPPKPVLAVSPPRAPREDRDRARAIREEDEQDRRDKGRRSPAPDTSPLKGRSRAADEDMYRSRDRAIPRNESRSSLPRYPSGGGARDDSPDSRDRERDRERERERQRARDKEAERSREKERESRSYRDSRDVDPRSARASARGGGGGDRDRARDTWDTRDTRESTSHRRSSTDRDADNAAREREYRKQRDSREQQLGRSGSGGGGGRSSRATSEDDEVGVTEFDSASQRAYKLAQEEKERERAQRKASEQKRTSSSRAPGLVHTSSAGPALQNAMGHTHGMAGYGSQYGMGGGYGMQPIMAAPPSFSMGTGLPIQPPPIRTSSGVGMGMGMGVPQLGQGQVDDYSYDPSMQQQQMMMMQQQAMQQQQQYNNMQRAQSSGMMVKSQSFSVPRAVTAGPTASAGAAFGSFGGGGKIGNIFQAAKAMGALNNIGPRPAVQPQAGGMQRVMSTGTMGQQGRATTQAMGTGQGQGRSAQEIAAKLKADKNKDRMSVLMEDDDTVLMG